MEINLGAAAQFEILEDVTSFAGGVAFTPLNFNRNSTTTSGATCLRGATGADLITPTGGTVIWDETTNARIATTRDNASELNLKQNSKYLFRVTNSTASNDVSILLTWYEHTNRN
jgi:hypothetical protein